MPRAKSKSPRSTAPALDIRNAALPQTTGTVRVAPQNLWSSRMLESMSKNRNRVTVSRFLQEELPVVKYAVQTLPREAIGKGIGLKSISANPDFAAKATALFNLWASSKACDLRKESTFYQLQPRWLSAILGDGSCFVQKVLGGDEASRGWSLADKSKRRCQFQTFTRDQISSPFEPSKPADKNAERWNDGLLYNGLGQLQKIRVSLDGNQFGPDAKFALVEAAFVSHLKDNLRFNQEHGTPVIFGSNNDLLDALDIKAVRKQSAKVRAAILGATVTNDGQVPNAMKSVMAAEKTGDPATDTGKRYVELFDGAIMLPFGVDEKMNWFTSTTEAVPFSKILEDLTWPFVLNFGIPPEWIFSMGSLGGATARAIIEKVRRAYENLRALLYPHLQWCWEFIIADAMMPGGPLAEFATVEDWNEIDYVTDPDPSVDLGRDHKADMDRWGENLITADDYIEARTGGSGVSVRRRAIDEKLDTIRYAIAQGTGETDPKKIMIPASICTILALGVKASQAASGLLSSLQPDQVAAELAAMDGQMK